MRKVLIVDERYPVYDLEEPEDSRPWQKTIEVPENIVERYKAALTEFNAVQRLLAGL